MKNLSLFFAGLAFIPACSLLDSVQKETAFSVPTATKVATPSKESARRDLGSLWQEDSRWNDLYSSAPSRAVGDKLVLSLEDPFKARIHRLFNPKDEKKAANTAVKDDSSQMLARIHRVDGRGIYWISSSEKVRIGMKEGVVSLQARMREKDIRADDSIPSGALFEIKVDADSVRNLEPDKVEEKKGDGSPQENANTGKEVTGS